MFLLDGGMHACKVRIKYNIIKGTMGGDSM
jgi:hypothetical protein